MLKLKFPLYFLGLSALTLSLAAPLHADSSETIYARKGLFRLLSADINEEDAYHFRTSVQYFQQSDLLKDVDNSTVRSTNAMLAFGYALLPQVHISAHGGFRLTTREPQTVTSNPLSGGSEAYETVKGGFAVTGTYDLGQKMNLSPNRFTGGLALWVNLEKITRIAKGPDVIPMLILSGDFSDARAFPFRTHLNLGYRLSNSKRYFSDSDTAVNDFDRFSTETMKSQAIIAATGIEIPFKDVNPSVEVHMIKAMDSNFSKSPKWATVGLKGKPFTQKNIEVFGAVDLGFSSFTATPAGTVPTVGATPLWNAVLGFGISQFGRRAGEVGVDQREYETVKQSLTEREKVIQGLQRDLEYNTIQGRVVDAETKKPMPGVALNIADNSDFKPSTTGDDGRFVRYFKALPGSRLTFNKEGYETSTKFLSLKPGERITVDIELKKATGENLADFVATVTDDKGRAVQARVSLRNVDTGELTVGQADPQGQISLKVPQGKYLVQVQANGFKTSGDQLEFTKGRTVLRNFSLSPAQ